MPLTNSQLQAANLLGAAHSRREVAEIVHADPATVSRWRKLPEFEAQVRRARRAHLDEHPSPRATLEAALSANRPDGQPDWRTRVQAAVKLLALGADTETGPEFDDLPPDGFGA
jgi:hypothetical protein